MNTLLDIRLSGGVMRLDLPPAWTGQIAVNVFKGRLSRELRLEEQRTVCPQCGTTPVTVGLASRAALGEG